MYRHQLGENLLWSHLGLKAKGLSGLRYVMLCYFMLRYVTTFCSELSFTFTRALFSRILASAQDYETSLYPDHSYYCAVVMDPRETSLFMMFFVNLFEIVRAQRSNSILISLNWLTNRNVPLTDSATTREYKKQSGAP